MWALDTDTLTLWSRGQATVGQRVEAHAPEELAITIITVEEVLSGWYRVIRQARDDEKLARAYRWLQQSSNSSDRFESCHLADRQFSVITSCAKGIG